MDEHEQLKKVFLEAISEGNEEFVRLLISTYGFRHTSDGGYSLLGKALRSKKFAIARILITNCVQVNNAALPQRSHDTPLHLAVGSRQMDIAEMLLNRGADINAIASCGLTSIGRAIQTDNLEFLELLYNRGVDLNAQGPDGLRPLLIAAKLGKEDAVILLLSYGADIDASSTDKKTALYFAAKKSHLKLVTRLLQFQPDVNNEGNKNSLYAAIYAKRKLLLSTESGNNKSAHYEPVSINFHYGLLRKKQIFQTLLEYGFVYELERGYDPQFFHGLVENGCLDVVEDLLKNGADANMEYCEETPLLLATKMETTDIAELLLFNGANVNARDGDKKTAIFYAAKSGNERLVNLFLAQGATINHNPDVMHAAEEQLLDCGCVDTNHSTLEGTTALQTSLQHGCEATTAPLLDKGARGTVRREDNQDTPLHSACSTGEHKICENFLRNGADVGSRNGEDSTPLHAAATVETVKALVRFGADVHSRNSTGKTPLHLAVRPAVAEALIKYGADIHARDSKGRTPLHIATRDSGNLVAEVFLKFGANVDSTDDKGKTALHFACGDFDDWLVQILLDAGADIIICDKKNRTPLECSLSSMIRNHNNNVIDDNSKFLQCFMFHLVKLQTIQMFVSERNLQGMQKALDIMERPLEDFAKDKRLLCQEEIGKLQSKKLTKLNISYYELLTKNTHALAILLRNDNIMHAFKPEDVNGDEFPIYAAMLKCQFRKAVERKGPVEKGFETFGYLCHELPHLPTCCVEEIFQYLSNKDLQMLVAACKASSQCPTEDKVMTACEGELSSDSSDEEDASNQWRICPSRA